MNYEAAQTEYERVYSDPTATDAQIVSAMNAAEVVARGESRLQLLTAEIQTWELAMIQRTSDSTICDHGKSFFGIDASKSGNRRYVGFDCPYCTVAFSVTRNRPSHRTIGPDVLGDCDSCGEPQAMSGHLYKTVNGYVCESCRLSDTDCANYVTGGCE